MFEDGNGQEMEVIEEFIIGNVQHPIMCVGRLFRKEEATKGGWPTAMPCLQSGAGIY